MFKIYYVRNNLTNKGYVGLTSKSLESRFRSRCRTRGRQAFGGLHLAIKAYGAENFEIFELETAATKEKAEEIESFCIGRYKTYYPYGYNLSWRGDGNTTERLRKFRFENEDPVIQDCFDSYPGL